MRVAIVTESSLPQVNGVTNTVRHVVRHLLRPGHQPLVIAPGPGGTDHEGVPVHRARSVRLPGYKSFPLGLPDVDVRRVLEDFRHYGVAADALLDRWVARVHRRADRTLVPSEAARQQLAGWGVSNVHLWRRGGLLRPVRAAEPLVMQGLALGGPGAASWPSSSTCTTPRS